MVILFNLWAIPVGIAIYLILLGVEHVSPALMAEPRNGWTIGIVSTLVGALCEIVGIRGRLFLLPIWMIGLGIICYHLGWPGTVAFIALLVIGATRLFKGAKKTEAADWQKAQQAALQAGEPPSSGDVVQFWEWVQTMLFLPVWLDFTPELCQHNLKVLRAIAQSGLPLTPEEAAALHALGSFLTNAQAASKPPGSEVKIQTPVSSLVDKRLSKAKREARRQKLAAPQPLPAAR